MTKLDRDLSCSDQIIETVISMQGGKATEIIANLPKICFNDDIVDIVQVIDYLVRTEQLIEVEYVLPQMDYRIKSFLLPANTKVTLRGKGHVKDI